VIVIVTSWSSGFDGEIPVRLPRVLEKKLLRYDAEL